MPSGQVIPHFLIENLETFPQLISSEVSDFIIYQISCGYTLKFLEYEIVSFLEVLNFSPPLRVSANKFVYENDTLFIYSRS